MRREMDLDFVRVHEGLHSAGANLQLLVREAALGQRQPALLLHSREPSLSEILFTLWTDSGVHERHQGDEKRSNKGEARREGSPPHLDCSYLSDAISLETT